MIFIFKKSYYISLFIISFMIDHIFSFELGSIFISPFKITSIVLSLIFIVEGKYYLQIKFSSEKGQRCLLLFILFNFLQMISLFYSPVSLSQKVNYLMMHFTAIIIVVGFFNILKKTNTKDTLKVISKNLSVFFLIEISLLTLEFLSNGRGSLLNIGLLNNPDLDGYRMVGFHWERLYYAEYLILGFLAVTFKKWKKRLLYFLFLTVLILVYLSDSYTGQLGIVMLLILFFVDKARMRIKKRFMLIIFALLAIGYILPSTLSMLNRSDRDFREIRKETYFQDSMETNWRIYSSTTLLKKFIDSPTIIGEGYKSNNLFLKGINKSWKAVSAHTFVSILHDQGILGIILFFLILQIQVSTNLNILRNLNKDASNKLLYSFVFMFNVLMILRFIFYYHSINQWIYLIAIPLNTIYWEHKKFPFIEV